jgi:L-seryl-tRNA(Ser) seleniumtransferase
MNEKQAKLRVIPAVDTIINAPLFRETLNAFPRWLVLDAVHHVLENLRREILSDRALPDQALALEGLVPMIYKAAAELERYHLRPLVNATGVVIHTNLGRSVLGKDTLEQIAAVSAHYSNLEYDLIRGERGSRYSHVETLLCRICDAESALVVNNNAGAVLLALNTLAEGKDVIVSRGQLVEIGGSFRIPDVIKKSGCRMVEVGTTNKTHPRDYQNAIQDQTACLLRVHMSNFEMRGFTREVSGRELAEIGREHGLAVMEDLGSGSLIDLSPYGLPKEPTVQESVQAGIDVVSFSGDKLLGGPQAGLLVGRKEIIDRIKKNPLARALRVDKMTLAGLEVTLREFLDPEAVLRRIPTLRMLTASAAELKVRAERLAALLRIEVADRLTIKVTEGFSQVGGGALPESSIPTYGIALGAPGISVNRLEQGFRSADYPVIGRILRDRFFLDLRTIEDHQFETIGLAAKQVLGMQSL